jgi:hypothetical protein|tara:strand:- start:4441 stop:4638 length:198 start_codon:yes stop_codon:yes gene_type:complete
MLNRVFLLKVFFSLCLPTAVTVAGLFLVWRSVDTSSKSGGACNSKKDTVSFDQPQGKNLAAGVPL